MHCLLMTQPFLKCLPVSVLRSTKVKLTTPHFLQLINGEQRETISSTFNQTIFWVSTNPKFLNEPKCLTPFGAKLPHFFSFDSAPTSATIFRSPHILPITNKMHVVWKFLELKSTKYSVFLLHLYVPFYLILIFLYVSCHYERGLFYVLFVLVHNYIGDLSYLAENWMVFNIA